MSEEANRMVLAPYITVNDAKAALAFYGDVFGAEERFRLTDPVDGRIGHAEMAFGGYVMMVSDEYPDFGAVAPTTLGGSPVKLHLVVADADATCAKAIAAGAVEIRPVKQQFYGNRSGVIADPYGHYWMIQSQTEAVDTEEMQRRWENSTDI